jgi:hypothetical protein
VDIEPKGQKCGLLLPLDGGIQNFVDGTCFYKSGIANALGLGLQEQSRALGIIQGQGDENLGGNFRKLPKR